MSTVSSLPGPADIVIVGGGSAGATLAARLSEDPLRHLLLGAVRGLSNLRVVDASIIPEVPSTVTNLTTIMLAERIFQRVYRS